MKLTRRSVLSAATLATASAVIPKRSVANQQPVYPVLGDPQEVFDTWFGTGTPIGDFAQFPQYAPGHPIYYARFPERRSVQVVGNFQTSDTPDGLPFTEDEAGISGFVPTDAISTHLYRDMNLGGSNLVRVWSGASDLPAIDGNQQIIVMDSTSGGILFSFTQTRVIFATPEITPLVPSSANDWLNTDTMWASISALQPAQSGTTLASPPLPGHFGISPGSIRGWFDTPISVSIVNDYLASILLPSRLLSTTWFPPDPLSNTGARFREFETIESGQRYMCLIVIEGDETTGVVSRFRVVTGSESNVRR